MCAVDSFVLSRLESSRVMHSAGSLGGSGGQSSRVAVDMLRRGRRIRSLLHGCVEIAGSGPPQPAGWHLGVGGRGRPAKVCHGVLSLPIHLRRLPEQPAEQSPLGRCSVPCSWVNQRLHVKVEVDAIPPTSRPPLYDVLQRPSALSPNSPPVRNRRPAPQYQPSSSPAAAQPQPSPGPHGRSAGW